MPKAEPSASKARPKSTRKAPKRRQARVLKSEPFLDDAIMDESPPACTRADFKQPRIRRSRYSLDATTFVGCINQDNPEADGGVDGYNWKVRFSDGGPDYVLKLFWDAESTEPDYYYSAKRECENAALFEMIKAALSEDKVETGPILVCPRPASQEAAEANLFAFSDEVRQERRSEDKAGDLEPLSEMPRMRRCYGWMQFTGAELRQRLPSELWPLPIKIEKLTRELDEKVAYTALVYEFVEEGENDRAVVQDVLNFLWCLGFSFCLSPKADNWESSVLLDYSDIIHYDGFEWDDWAWGLSRPRKARHILQR